MLSGKTWRNKVYAINANVNDIYVFSHAFTAPTTTDDLFVTVKYHGM